MLSLIPSASVEDLVGELGICLATGFLHQLTDEEALQFGLAAPERLHFIGMGAKQLIHDGFDRADH